MGCTTMKSTAVQGEERVWMTGRNGGSGGERGLGGVGGDRVE